MAYYDILTGMLDSDGWNDSNRRPKNWREYILYLEPNGGSSPLTALLSLTKGEATDDPEFYWWEQRLDNQAVTITNVQTAAGVTDYNPGSAAAIASAGDTLYFYMSAGDLKKIRTGHILAFRDASAITATAFSVTGLVTAKNTSTNYVTVTLLQDDVWVTDHGFIDHDHCDVAIVSGSAHEEGDTLPDPVVYEPVKLYNMTQIFRTPLKMTRTAMNTRLRTGDHVKQAKEEALRMHNIAIERAFFFGHRYETTGTSGYPLRTTAGIFNWPTNSAATGGITKKVFSGTWMGTTTDNGYYWLFTQLEELFRYGSPDRIAFCGSEALLALNRAAQENGDLQIKPESTKFGMQFNTIMTPFGTIRLKGHPLFNIESTLRDTMVILDPKNLKYRYLKNGDTTYKPDLEYDGMDGKASEYITECGLEVHHGATHMIIAGLG